MSPVVRSARTSFGPLLLGLGLLLVTAPLPAQLGGLVKKAKDKVAPAAGVQTSTDQPARMPAPEATSQSIDHLLTGLKAEKGVLDQEAEAARQRQAAEERQRRAADAASEQQNCVEAKMKADPDYAKMEKLGRDAEAASKAGDNQKAMDLAMQMAPMAPAIQQRAQAACAAPATPAPAPAVSSADAAAIQGAAGNPGESGAKAAGMTVVEYGQLKELIYTYFTYPKRAGLSDSEKRAIDAKRTELQAGLKAIGMLGS